MNLIAPVNKFAKILTQQQINNESDDELNEEINDKLSELWTGMRNKRKQMIRNLTPSNKSRRSQRTLSSMNNNLTNNCINNNNTTIMTNMSNPYRKINKSTNHVNQSIRERQQSQSLLSTKQLIKRKNKNANEKPIQQIKRLKQTIEQLTGENSQLLEQLRCLENNINERGQQMTSSIDDYTEIIGQKEHYSIQNDDTIKNNTTTEEQYQHLDIDGRTAHFQKKHNNNKNKKQEMFTNNINKKCSLMKRQRKNQISNTKNRKNHNVTNYSSKNKSLSSKSSTFNHKNNIKNNKSNKQNINFNSNTNYNTTKTTIINNSYHNKSSTTQSIKQKHSFPSQQTLPTLNTNRLIQLLKSTTQYRQFAYYYDSHQLSYLKRLQQQHKKNCHINLSQNQKKYWAPTQLIQTLTQKNNKHNWGLNQQQVEQIIGEIKSYYEKNQQLKLRQQKDYYMRKIQKLKRQKQNNVPYDLVRLSNAKQRVNYANKNMMIKINKNINNSKNETMRY